MCGEVSALYSLGYLKLPADPDNAVAIIYQCSCKTTAILPLDVMMIPRLVFPFKINPRGELIYGLTHES